MSFTTDSRPAGPAFFDMLATGRPNCTYGREGLGESLGGRSCSCWGCRGASMRFQAPRPVSLKIRQIPSCRVHQFHQPRVHTWPSHSRHPLTASLNPLFGSVTVRSWAKSASDVRGATSQRQPAAPPTLLAFSQETDPPSSSPSHLTAVNVDFPEPRHRRYSSIFHPRLPSRQP